ncbi:MAG: glycosyltransferase [Bacteroides sp.]|nr:glycosyltransferase [Bacteroides sp.]MCM1413247.1 glycosyltransferase [Bacteroides sp.]MCM1471443.1 glycosyltransferase [Bacteroides sp.]
MKILQIGKFHPIKGGVEKVMFDLTNGLSNRGHKCDMLCAAAKGHYTLQLNHNARLIAVSKLFELKSTMISPAMILRLRRIANDYDIIHIHHPDPMAALALRLSGFKGRVVLHWHSDIVRQRQLLRIIRPLQSWLIRRADVIIGTSPTYISQSPWLADVQEKCVCVPIGIRPVEEVPEKAVEEIRRRFKNRRIIFAMGRLVSYKGFEYLIDAAQYLPPDCVVAIGGTGPLHDSLQKRITDLGLSSRVILWGFVPAIDLPAIYRASSLFCMPSIERTEAFGVVQIEAMSCGTPVVACRIPGSGVSWVNADGLSGLNVEPRRPRELADAIQRVIESPDDSFRTGALRRFHDEFTIDRMLEKIEKIYKDIHL